MSFTFVYPLCLLFQQPVHWHTQYTASAELHCKVPIWGGVCRDLVVTNAQLSMEGMRGEVGSGTRTLDTFRSDVSKYQAQQQQVKALAASVDCGIVRIQLQVKCQGMY